MSEGTHEGTAERHELEGWRVLEVLGSSAGGVARHVRQVAEVLTGRGARVVVAGPRAVHDDAVPADPVPGRGVVRTAAVEISDRPSGGDVAAVRLLRRLARDAEVVHAHGLRAGALTVLATRGVRDRPVVLVTLHNLPVGGAGIRAVAGVLEIVVARGADVVLGVSGDLVARAAARGARRTERALVPAPPRPPVGEPERARASVAPAARDRLLVTVARLAQQKGLDLLLDAAAHLAGEEVLWVVAGDGPLRDHLAGRIEAEGLPVRLLGRRGDVADLMAAADVVVSTARWEGQPLAVQEALAIGAAVVATDVGGTREVTGDAAVLVPYDAAAVAQAVRSLLRDAAAAERLRAAAADRAARLPGPTEAGDQLARLFTTARAGRRRRRDDVG